MRPHRLERVTRELRAADIDWLALVPGPSFTYLSGIHAHTSERPIVLFVAADGRVGIVIPALEAMKAEAVGIAADHIFAWRDVEGYEGAFAAARRTLGLQGRRVGVEALKMRVLEADVLTEIGGARVLHADHILDGVRLSKDADEIAVMQRAAAIAEMALTHLLPTIRIGQTERAIAARLTQALLDAGADGPAFDPIVSAGPNAASPHAVPTERPIGLGELLIIDWGARVGDYVSDITRTFALGPLNEALGDIYAAVQAGNAAGCAVCRPGVSGEAIDRAARAAIEAAGYGDYFIHRTGHGLGMEAHESPSLMAGNRAPLPVGAAFTVEPGVYLSGLGGARIEDNIVLTADGYLSLTTLPRDLQTIGL